MKQLRTFIFICIAAICLALTPAERAIVKHVQELNTRQKSELEDTRAKLVWTDKELQDTQPKIDQISKERDQYQNLYASDHEALLKSKAGLLRRDITIIALVSAIGIWAFLKFYLHIPFL